MLKTPNWLIRFPAVSVASALVPLTLGVALLIPPVSPAEAVPVTRRATLRRVIQQPSSSYFYGGTPVWVNPAPGFGYGSSPYYYPSNNDYYYGNYPNSYPGFPSRHRVRVDDSTLLNPTLVNPRISDSVLINPVIINSPRYRQYPFGDRHRVRRGSGIFIQIN